MALKDWIKDIADKDIIFYISKHDKRAITVGREYAGLDNNYKSDCWTVTVGTNIINEKTLKVFYKTKSQSLTQAKAKALKFAKDYMRRH